MANISFNEKQQAQLALAGYGLTAEERNAARDKVSEYWQQRSRRLNAWRVACAEAYAENREVWSLLTKRREPRWDGRMTAASARFGRQRA